MEENKIPEFIKRTMDQYGVQGKELAERLGISTTHLSQFRNGKTSISLDMLWQMVSIMDEMSPGSRAYFCQLLAGKTPMRQQANRSFSLEDIVDVASDQEIYQIIMKIGQRWNQTIGSRNTDTERSLLKV